MKRKPRRAAAAAAAAAAPASLPPGLSLTAVSPSVGSAHGWHQRTGRRFVGDGDDCDTLGEGEGRQRRFLTQRSGDDAERRVSLERV